MDSSFSAWPTISSTIPTRPKQAFGAGGGNSPEGTLWKDKTINFNALIIADLTVIYVMVSILFVGGGGGSNTYRLILN